MLSKYPGSVLAAKVGWDGQPTSPCVSGLGVLTCKANANM